VSDEPTVEELQAIIQRLNAEIVEARHKRQFDFREHQQTRERQRWQVERLEKTNERQKKEIATLRERLAADVDARLKWHRERLAEALEIQSDMTVQSMEDRIRGEWEPRR
jgi:predicted RNase H-like nuclease (RuvC/YqgF family)